MTKLTKTAVVQALEEILEEKGEDYVYPYAAGTGSYEGCKYTEGDAPSCIVGQVIAKLDPELFEDLKEFEYEYGSFPVYDFSKPDAPQVASYAEDESPEAYYPTLDAELDVIEILNIAQAQQDGGSTYGKAVGLALEKAN